MPLRLSTRPSARPLIPSKYLGKYPFLSTPAQASGSDGQTAEPHAF